MSDLFDSRQVLGVLRRLRPQNGDELVRRLLLTTFITRYRNIIINYDSKVIKSEMDEFCISQQCAQYV